MHADMHAEHRGPPQTFTALPKVLGASMGLLTCPAHMHDTARPQPQLSEAVRAWVQAGGAAPFEHYTPDRDPVIQARSSRLVWGCMASHDRCCGAGTCGVSVGPHNTWVSG